MTLSTSIGFERSPVRGAILDDLDQEACETYLGRRVPSRMRDRFTLEQITERVGLTGKSGPNLVRALKQWRLLGPQNPG